MGDPRRLTSRPAKAHARPPRDVKEELGLDIALGAMFVLDWAPHPAEGDKLLIIFDGGRLDQPQVDRLLVAQHELSAARFFAVDQLHQVLPARLARRVVYAAIGQDGPYLEHGTAPAPVLN